VGESVKRFRFGPDAAWPVDDYGSAFRLSRLLQTQTGEVRVDVAIAVPIAAGGAAFWREGKPHTVGTDGGLTVPIVEAEALGPGSYLQHASAAPLLRSRRRFVGG
jgi:hypothetical protein